MNDTGHPTEDDLRPILAELRELRNRCRSLGNRNEEFPEMARHLDRLLGQITSGRDARGLPIDYREIARQLFPVTHLFESVGFLTEGRQIADIEKRLIALAPGDAPPLPPAPPPDLVPPRRPPEEPVPVGAPSDRSTAADGDVDDLPPARRFAPTPPIVGATVLATVAIVACVWIILRHDPRAAIPEPTPTPVPTATPTPPPTPTPAGETTAERIERERRQRLLGAVAAARRSLTDGDVDAAISHLDEAAAIDPTPGVVVDTAQEAADRLLDMARAAADATQWQVAQSRLDQARTLVRRFSLDETQLVQTESFISRAPRFRRYLPADWRGLNAETGRRAVVEIVDGTIVDGVIGSAGPDGVVLVRRDTVGGTGGVVHYEDEIAAARIREVRVFDR